VVSNSVKGYNIINWAPCFLYRPERAPAIAQKAKIGEMEALIKDIDAGR
jgi:hypothetical protein